MLLYTKKIIIDETIHAAREYDYTPLIFATYCNPTSWLSFRGTRRGVLESSKDVTCIMCIAKGLV